MSKRVITILLMSTLVLSLACGCKNNDTESTSSTASKTESSVSSSAESSKQSESKAESSKQSESSIDKDYEEMMSYVNKLSPELTYEQVLEILGEPDSTFDGGLHLSIWDFGKYAISIQGSNDILTICDSENDKITKVYSKNDKSGVESSKQSESSIDKDYEEMMSRVNKLSSKLTYDQVYEIMGEPDGRTGSGVDYAYYKFGKYTVEIIDFNYSVIIHNNETGETTKIY